VSLLIAIFVGGIIGGLGTYLVQRGLDHLVMNILVGVSGGIFGVALYWISNFEGTDSLLNLRATLCSIVAAAIFVLIFIGLHHAAPEKEARVDDPNGEEQAREEDS
jgi:uncharacterized membrane protein YeaQ/YmgE (transglycosylase-associated protein family)